MKITKSTKKEPAVNALIKKIDTLMSKVDLVNCEVPYINNGGCGVFAEKLYNQFRNLGFKPKLIVLTDNKMSLNAEIKLGDKFNTLPVGAFTYPEAQIIHVVVEVCGDYIDCTGTYSSLETLIKDHGYTKNQSQLVKVDLNRLQKWNDNPNNWNGRFNRKHITKIEKLLAA